MPLQPNTKVHNVDGENLVVESGGTVTLKSGGTLNVESGGTVNVATGGALVAAAGTLSIGSLVGLAADGLDASSEAKNITLTGATVGQRVVIAFGHVKADSAAHTFVVSTGEFETAISKADNIVQNKGANLSANTYLFLLSPAAG